MQLTARVGKLARSGDNRYADVKLVQTLINKHIASLTPLRLLAEDGRIGPMTINSIEEFQRRVCGLKYPDATVDPGGRTWRHLIKPAGSQPAVPVPPPPPPASDAPRVVLYKDTLSMSERIVSAYTLGVIRMAVEIAGLQKAVITSTLRTPEQQAQIMYKYASINLAKQYGLYGKVGDQVLKVFERNRAKPRNEVIALMVAEIESLLKQGKRVSRHVVNLSTYNMLNVVDIGVNSTRSVNPPSAFKIEKVTQAFWSLKKGGYISEFIDETNIKNQCWHIEVRPNQKPLPA